MNALLLLVALGVGSPPPPEPPKKASPDGGVTHAPKKPKKHDRHGSRAEED